MVNSGLTERSLYIKPFPGLKANTSYDLLYNYFLQFQVVKAVGVWYVFYFVITIFFCSFYLLNLVLAVVYLSYEKELHSLEQEVSEINSMSTRIVRQGRDMTTYS